MVRISPGTLYQPSWHTEHRFPHIHGEISTVMTGWKGRQCILLFLRRIPLGLHKLAEKGKTGAVPTQLRTQVSGNSHQDAPRSPGHSGEGGPHSAAPSELGTRACSPLTLISEAWSELRGAALSPRKGPLSQDRRPAEPVSTTEKAAPGATSPSLPPGARTPSTGLISADCQPT